MRIAHIGLAAPYTEGMTYQDNFLVKQNVQDGHETLYIAQAAKFVNGKIVETGYEDTVIEGGAHLIRLPYVHVVNKFVSSKIRKVKGLYDILEGFEPDVILSHDLAYYSVLDVIKYKKMHMDIKLYADTHTDDKNSGGNWWSIHILHRVFYKYLTQKTLKYLEKYLNICPASKKFSMENYGVPEELMMFWPLGAKIFSEEEFREKREKKRKELDLRTNELLLIHSGKLDKLKKTEDLLKAFKKVESLYAKLVIIGSIGEEVQKDINELINMDKRVVFLGWKSGEELLDYLCACDLYCQPGSCSATLQNAIGCFCPVLCYPEEIYVALDKGNFIWVKNEEDIVSALEKIESGNIRIADMTMHAKECALEFLDYSKIVQTLYK